MRDWLQNKVPTNSRTLYKPVTAFDLSAHLTNVHEKFSDTNISPCQTNQFLRYSV